MSSEGSGRHPTDEPAELIKKIVELEGANPNCVSIEKALIEEAGKLQAILDTTVDGIITINEQAMVVSFNRAAERIFGYEAEEVIGHNVNMLQPSPYRENHDQYVANYLLTRVPKIIGIGREVMGRRKDGSTFPLYLAVSEVRVRDKRYFTGIVRDITERKQAEKALERYRNHLEEMVLERTRELQEAHTALLQEEKLKILGTISAEMAHEIRNPLMSIGGFARRLLKKLPDVPEIGIVVEESERLETILKRIEHYLKPVEMRPRECSVNAITEEAVGLLSPELRREQVNVYLDLAPQIASAYVDPGVLIQVLVNVIRNAAKVMEKNGKITVKTFETDQNIHVYIRAPVLGNKIKDPEHPFMPFAENARDISVPVCLRLLAGMGAHLSLKQEKDTVVFSTTLLKAFQPNVTGDQAAG